MSDDGASGSGLSYCRLTRASCPMKPAPAAMSASTVIEVTVEFSMVFVPRRAEVSHSAVRSAGVRGIVVVDMASASPVLMASGCSRTDRIDGLCAIGLADSIEAAGFDTKVRPAVGVGDRDELFDTAAKGLPLEARNAVFGDEDIGIDAGDGDGAPL